MEFETNGLTYEDIQKAAVEIQDACNPLAVANYLVRASKVVSNNGGGFDAVRSDPYLKAIVGKLCHLYGIEHDGMIYDVLYK